MKRELLLGIIAGQLVACATGDFAKIDEVYKENMAQCGDANSELRKVFPTQQQCETRVIEVRDESNRNKHSVFRRLPGGGGAGDIGFVLILN